VVIGYRPTVAEISLDALAHNIRAFRSVLPAGTKLLASVKANAYGHGSLEVAREAVAAGVDYLGVAFLDEALYLRKAGVTTPILVLGYTPPEGFPPALEHHITLTLFREDQLQAAEALPAGGPKLKVHVKVDTGMGRIGVRPDGEAERFLEKACALPQLEVEGVYTHYATADEADKTYTNMQAERFARVVDYVRRHGLPPHIFHMGNSAAGIDLPDLVGGMLRLGIGLYGLYPSEEVRRERVSLEPVMTLKTRVVQVKTMPPGEGVSYGIRYRTGGTERIGTLPIGYADGFSRMLTGKAEVLLRGRRVPVVGTICMDQCMIRLDPAEGAGEPPVAPGEEVVLIGRQGGETITAGELAAKLGTIHYEVVCMVTARVPRVYVKQGRIVSVVNPLLD